MVASELADVARRIYDQSVTGRNVAASVARLQRSAALAEAVARGDRGATRAALQPLLKHQILRIAVFDRSRELVSLGRRAAFAPVSGRLRDAHGRTVGHFLIAVGDDRGYAAFTRRLTGAAVLMRSGRRRLAGALPPRARGETYTLRGQAFPAGRLRITLRIARGPGSLCAADPPATRLNAIGLVARRVLRAEGRSRAVTRAVRHVARDPAFRRAVASGDRAATRAAIVGFFRDDRLHVVRVRATRRRRLLLDVGGPYVLAPAGGVVRAPGGRIAGRFSLAVQDDAGYIKLVHRFTGAEVVLATRARIVPGSTLDPGPTTVPAHGTVAYRGKRYLATTFAGAAFPSGRLRITLLVAPGAPRPGR